ncbi:MAG: hypothetical protein WD689_05665 [Gaiellaceae bacterium]
MSTWDHRVTNHDALEALSLLELAIEESAEAAGDEGLAEAHARLDAATVYIRQRVAAADPQLVPPPLLDQLQPDLSNAHSQVAAFIEHRTAAYLDDANSHIDQALAKVGLPTSPDPLAAQGFRDGLVAFRQSASAHLRHLEGEVDPLRADLTDLREEVNKQKAAIDRDVARLDTAISQYQQQFSTSEAQRTQAFTQRMDELKSSMDAALAEAKNEVDAALGASEGRILAVEKSAEERSDALLAEMALRKEEAAKVAQFVGAAGVTGGYQKVSNEEKKAADRWRWVALGAFVLAAAANGIILYIELDFDVGLTALMATRLSVSIPLLALAAYAVAESRHHRRREQENRQLELQLASIDPYLALLPEDRQHAIKEGRVDRFFPGFPGLQDDLGAG